MKSRSCDGLAAKGLLKRQLSSEEGRLFVGPEIQVYPHLGDILAPKTWLATKIINKSVR